MLCSIIAKLFYRKYCCRHLLLTVMIGLCIDVVTLSVFRCRIFDVVSLKLIINCVHLRYSLMYIIRFGQYMDNGKVAKRD